ncbi:MAG: class I SAM-dependent methyltransferase [Catenulispora sp.]|nr:class I SAM-dependent methyltransferase [Catenulispora sp.]
MGEDLARFQHPRFARFYIDVSTTAERRGAAEHRGRLLAGLSGRVAEIGAGNGLNFAHYPREVTEVVAIEPDAVLRAAAERAAADAPVPITVMAGHADAPPLGEASVDAVVLSLVLCSVPHPMHALAEVRRVLRAGGQVRFYEHVRSRFRIVGLLQDVVTPVWRRQAAGCHPNRDTLSTLRSAGFVVEKAEDFGFAPTAWSPPLRHILGTATKQGPVTGDQGDSDQAAPYDPRGRKDP